jgi:hypothetical protein
MKPVAVTMSAFPSFVVFGLLSWSPAKSAAIDARRCSELQDAEAGSLLARLLSGVRAIVSTRRVHADTQTVPTLSAPGTLEERLHGASLHCPYALKTLTGLFISDCRARFAHPVHILRPYHSLSIHLILRPVSTRR